MKCFQFSRTILGCTFLVGLLFQGAACRAQQGKDYLLVLSKKEHVLAKVDPVSLEVLEKIPVGEDPHELAVSSDRSTAYVSIYGGGRFHTLNAIDLINNKRLDDIDTRPLYGPHGMVFIDNKVWFSAEGSKAIGRYDPTNKLLDWSMGTGEERSHMLYVSKDAKTVYASNVNAGSVSILEAGNSIDEEHHEWKHTILKTAKGSEGFDVSPDGKELWTASSQDGSITILDVEAKQLIAQFDGEAKGANRLRFSADGSMVFVSSLSQKDLLLYEVKSRKLIKRIAVGTGAAGIEVEPSGRRIYVACTPDHYVSVIDLDSKTVIGKIALGNPDGMAWCGN